MQLLLGADPEVFVRQGGQPISAFNMIPGTKEEPFPTGKGAVQVDGMALEYNINPADTEEVFVDHIQSVLGELSAMIPQDCELDISPTTFFDEDYLKKQPEAARILGCDPDFNAYTGEMNESPEPHKSMRTAAGHVHLGWTDAQTTDKGGIHFQSCCRLVKQLDYGLGLLGVLYDPDTKRKEMYGMPGAFRPKPYGVEYRVLSNWWINQETYIRLVYKHSRMAFDDFLNGLDYYQKFGDSAREVILSHDAEGAKTLFSKMGWDV